MTIGFIGSVRSGIEAGGVIALRILVVLVIKLKQFCFQFKLSSPSPEFTNGVTRISLCAKKVRKKGNVLLAVFR